MKIARAASKVAYLHKGLISSWIDLTPYVGPFVFRDCS